MSKYVVITGAANGLGKALAEIFLSRGLTVFATDKHFKEEDHDDSNPGLFRLHMDVCDETSVWKAYQDVIKHTDCIDILINNAGVFDLYPLTEATPEQISSVYEVNTFGMLRVVRVFSPMLVKARGRIINISSESVKFPALFQPYQASKIAMEAIHMTLRQELYLKGVTMTLIRPGAIRTGMSQKVFQVPPIPGNSIFSEEYARFGEMAKRFTGKFSTPEYVAGRIYRIATEKCLKKVYRIRNNPVLTIMSLTPSGLMNRFLKRKLG